jgi:LacI family transcriptional regulator
VAGARSAVSYLIRLGYTRVGTITGPLNTTVGLDRLEGYRVALDEKGLVLDERLLVEGDFTESGGYLAAQRLLEHKPEAIFAASDMMALGAVRAIREANLSVPQDIAVVGYDDLPPATLSDPPLTTVRQPIHHMGIELVETLLDIIENRNQRPQRKIFETELVIRESCGSKISALNSFHDRR